MNKPSDRWDVWYVAYTGLTVCLALSCLAPTGLWVALPAACAFLALGAIAARGALRRWSPDERVKEAAKEKFEPGKRGASKGEGVTDREMLM
jgi:hypothetical protein